MTTLTPEGEVDSGMSSPTVAVESATPRPPVTYIPAAEYLARLRAETDPDG